MQESNSTRLQRIAEHRGKEGGEAEIMYLVDVNIVAILAATVLSMIIGFIWYGPLFGKAWMKFMGFTEKSIEEAKKKGMRKSYAFSLLSTLVMTFILSQLIVNTGAATATQGVMLGGLVWLGFVATTMLNDVLFGKKELKLYLINVGYQLVLLLLSGAILAVWV